MAQTPFNLAGIYDVQTHQASAVVTYEVKSYGAIGKLNLDLLGLGGSTVGPNASVTGGAALALSYPLSFNKLSVRASFGFASLLTADEKPHFGILGMITGVW